MHEKLVWYARIACTPLSMCVPVGFCVLGVVGQEDTPPLPPELLTYFFFRPPPPPSCLYHLRLSAFCFFFSGSPPPPRRHCQCCIFSMSCVYNSSLLFIPCADILHARACWIFMLVSWTACCFTCGGTPPPPTLVWTSFDLGCVCVCVLLNAISL